MKYFINLFSPDTYRAFTNSDQSISGFRPRQQNAAERIEVGDRLVCYVTKIGRWCGVFEVISSFFKDDKPIFTEVDDPFIIRFKIKPLIWLPFEKSIPIRDEIVWEQLSFTKGQDKNRSSWTGKIRASLTALSDEDGKFIEQLLNSQRNDGKIFPIDPDDKKRMIIHRVRRIDKEVTVSVPENDEDDSSEQASHSEIRESIKIQALLAAIGNEMGMKIWIPRNDRVRVLSEWKNNHSPLVDVLPLNYDDATLRTIEQIDVLWLKGHSIVRAFEVEHTTSIYSGILRMADLLALQPNMEIKLHIVAPGVRKAKVFQELKRPVFSLLENKPLSERCTFLTYDSIRELSGLKHLAHLSDSVLEDYIEEDD
jgi:predicted RNA-binding protein